MGNSLTASYRLVYFQPDPEDGERVCVALLITARGDVEVLYDRGFPKLRCLAPHIDPKLVRFYLDDMKSHLRRGSSEVELLMGQRTPHIVTSEARKLAWPLSDSSRAYLVQRFLGKEKGEDANKVDRKAKADLLNTHLRQLVQPFVRNEPEVIQEWATPEWILGREVPHQKINPVALAVRRDDGVVLIDGVDLTVFKPKSALSRVTEVKHTFWQYGRIKQMGLNGRGSIRRIGVVLNGLEKPNEDYRDAHDFALSEFEQGADLAVDAASGSDLQELERSLTVR
jgi:hypothetical protein